MLGGGYDTSCKLCPVKGGAFKKSKHGKDWVHLVGRERGILGDLLRRVDQRNQ